MFIDMKEKNEKWAKPNRFIMDTLQCKSLKGG